jgi:hypothetical protein
MKKSNITRTGLADKSQGKTDWERLKKRSKDESHRAAVADPDAQPSTPERLATMKRVTPEQMKDGRKHLPGRPVSKEGRFELRLDPDLKQWADGYSASIGIKTSGLVRMLLLKEKSMVEA